MFSFKIFSMMENKDLLKKQELAEELGMKFDEASELFSEETLETMRMINVVGGSAEGDNNVDRCGCSVNDVDRCGCVESTDGKKCYPAKSNCVSIYHTKGGDKCDKCGETPTPQAGGEVSTPGPEEDFLITSTMFSIFIYV